MKVDVEEIHELPALPGAHAPLVVTSHCVQPELQPPSVQNFILSGVVSARAAASAASASASARSGRGGRCERGGGGGILARVERACWRGLELSRRRPITGSLSCIGLLSFLDSRTAHKPPRKTLLTRNKLFVGREAL